MGRESAYSNVPGRKQLAAMFKVGKSMFRIGKLMFKVGKSMFQVVNSMFQVEISNVLGRKNMFSGIKHEDKIIF